MADIKDDRVEIYSEIDGNYVDSGIYENYVDSEADDNYVDSGIDENYVDSETDENYIDSKIDENYVDSGKKSINEQINQCYHRDDAVLFETLYEKLGNELYCYQSVNVNGIYYAAKFSCPNIIKYLYKIDPENINTTSFKNGATPLMVAAHSNNIDIVKFLLELGADPTINARIGTGKTYLALDIARRHKNLEIVELLESNMLMTKSANKV